MSQLYSKDMRKQKKVKMYETMVRIRSFENRSVELANEGLTPGRMHPYVGQEAIAAGVCHALRDSDLIVSTHRNGGHLIAQQADPRMLFAEYLGKATGYSKGKGGPMHISIPELGVLCTNGIVGSGIPIAAGAALANVCKESDNVVCCFFGDGAANTGSFHEGLNLASIWRLPVVFICENNMLAETMPFAMAFPVEKISTRAISYGIPGETIDGNDVLAVYDVAAQAISQARAGDGPMLIEALTYRIGPHFSGESSHYRDNAEIERWKRQDPIIRYRGKLIQDGIEEDSLKTVEEAAAVEMERAADQAKIDPFPSPEELLNDVLARDSLGVAT
jgi:TPP-dependent pyruvate/acetoin dehydrogenase alpha subunit